MPLDLQSIKDASDKGLLELVDRQGTGLEDTLASYTGNIKRSRNQFLENTFNPLFNSALSNLHLASTGAGMARANNTLDRALQSAINQKRFEEKKRNLGLKVDTRNRLGAENASALNAAKDYGRGTALTKSDQDFEAQQAEQDRQFQLTLDNIRQEFFNRGQELEDQYQPKTNYEAALSEAFGSLLGTGVSSYAINRVMKPQPDFSVQKVPIPFRAMKPQPGFSAQKVPIPIKTSLDDLYPQYNKYPMGNLRVLSGRSF